MKAIVTDLDGTILPSRGSITPEIVSGFKELENHRILRIIATGRTLYAAQKVLDPDFPIDYLIFSSGAGIMEWKSKEIIFSAGLNQKTTRDLAEYLWELNTNFFIQKEIPDNHHFFYTDLYPVHTDYLKRLEIFHEFGTPIFTREDITSGATQFLIIIDPGRLSLIDKIKKELSEYSVIRATSPYDYKAVWIEIFPLNIHKGSAMSWLLSRHTIKLEESAGLGNDFNDIDFLDLCKYPYVVKNAPDILKKRYKQVSADREGGFLEFLREMRNT